MTTIDTLDDLQKGIEALARREPRFAAMMRETGMPPLRRRDGGYRGLLNIVTGQQVSTASAAAIWARMEESLSPLEPGHLDGLDDTRLQAAGLSRPKIRTIRSLTRAVLDGTLDLDRLGAMADEEVHAALTAIKGIGPWTADVYLLACLGRRDAWPAGDLALQTATAAAFGLDTRPDARRMQALGMPWRPWRAVAARLIWAYYRTLPSNRNRIPDPI
ncbi:DNA-3-methyladenine glycosylase 2 family protein [Kaustia mangrovi]|uniref:DNA-3-methyladenine glycosylase II n=1 Tax=Kaustia mangrovi TaxID=2593653 RepID=A0A7S8C4K8_9HYPH|nr:DNA-3-methyladenine glycosylase 2 family protein [Kaustia mangrovi]QPC43298.1 DNA-3-methyladenine glycosylase 2 family protein [Kaustia mangrovi]